MEIPMSDDPKLHPARVKHFGRKLKAMPEVAAPATPKQATHPTAPKAVADPVQKKLATVAGIASSRHTQSGNNSRNRKTTYARHANLHVCECDEAESQLAMRQGQRSDLENPANLPDFWRRGSHSISATSFGGPFLAIDPCEGARIR